MRCSTPSSNFWAWQASLLLLAAANKGRAMETHGEDSFLNSPVGEAVIEARNHRIVEWFGLELSELWGPFQPKPLCDSSGRASYLCVIEGKLCFFTESPSSPAMWFYCRLFIEQGDPAIKQG